MRKTMNDGTDTVKARVRKVRAGQGDVAARSIGGGKRRAMMAGWHRASIADSAGQSRASTFSRSRDAGTAILLNANWLPRDARSVIPLNAKSPENVEAQLPLVMFASSHSEEVAGSLPPPSNVSVGPYTSCSLAIVSHESDKSLADLSMSRLQSDIDPGARHKSDPTPYPLPGEGDLSRAHHGHHAHPNKVTTITGGHH